MTQHFSPHVFILVFSMLFDFLDEWQCFISAHSINVFVGTLLHSVFICLLTINQTILGSVKFTQMLFNRTKKGVFNVISIGAQLLCMGNDTVLSSVNLPTGHMNFEWLGSAKILVSTILSLANDINN